MKLLKTLSAMALALFSSISIAEGPVISGSLFTNNMVDGAVTAMTIVNGTASVEMGTVTGNVEIPGSTNLNNSVDGAVTAMSIVDGCASVRMATVSDAPICKGSGGGLLSSLFGGLF